jgi:lipopolysaccharide transport system permease protein
MSGRSDVPLTVIRPAVGWARPRIREAWQRRELLLFFAVRDIKVRYAQTALGAVWTVAQPIGLMLIFTFAFRKIARVSTEEVPYPLFVFSALALWTFFSRSVVLSSDSLVANSALLTKTSAPRLLMPVFPIVSGLFDFAVNFVLLLGFAAAYGELPTWRVVFVPVVLAGGCVLALGLGLLLSAVNVRYRDVRQALPFSVQLLLFLSPIAYPLSQLGEPWSTVLAINPLVGLIDAFRWSVVGTAAPGATELLFAICVPLALLVAGAIYFTRVERVFADVA